MLHHAFRHVGRVIFCIDPANYRLQRAVEKIGGARTGTRTDPSGRVTLVFEIAARDWLSPPRALGTNTLPRS